MCSYFVCQQMIYIKSVYFVWIIRLHYQILQPYRIGSNIIIEAFKFCCNINKKKTKKECMKMEMTIRFFFLMSIQSPWPFVSLYFPFSHFLLSFNGISIILRVFFFPTLKNDCKQSFESHFSLEPKE